MALVEIERHSSTFLLYNLIVFTLLCCVTSFPNGAPSYSCRNLIPGHSNGTQSSPPPYSVDVPNTVLEPGQRATVSVTSTGNFPFLGFICAASDLEDPNHLTVGTMRHSERFMEKDLLKPVSCSKSDPDTAMTHTSRRDKFKVEFEWTPPADAGPGQGFKLRCTVVQSFFRCWTGIQENIFIGQSSTTSGTTTSQVVTKAEQQPDNGNNAVSGNNKAIQNAGISLPQQPSLNNQLSVSPSSNQNQNPIFDFPQPNQDTAGFPETVPSGFLDPFGIDLFPSPPNQISNIAIPIRNFLTSSQLPNQINDIAQNPGANEIPALPQSIDLALLIDLINMGVITLQDGIVSFSSIQSPSFDTLSLGGGLSPSNSPNEHIAVSHRNVENPRLKNNNRQRSIRGPNSRGLFQSSNPRPFNPNFNRIRQPRSHNSNKV